MFDRLSSFFSDPDKMLFEAINEGSVIKAHAAIKIRENYAYILCTHLEHAISRHRSEIIKLLLQAGADANQHDHDGDTPLFNAIREGCAPDIIKLLLEAGADVSEVDNQGHTPLFNAIGEECAPDIIRLLLEAGADVNQANNQGKTPLFKASREGCASEIITLLLLAGADVNQPAQYGETPLMMAAASRSIDIATLLLKNGALIDFVDDNGESALFHAAKIGALNIIELLVEAGANTELKNQKDKTAGMLSDNNETRAFLMRLVSERNNSLPRKLKEFENLIEQRLNKEYSSEKIAQKSAKDISTIIWKSSANNVRFLFENIDKLPIDMIEVRNFLFDWSNFLIILSAEELTNDKQEKFEDAADAVRRLAATLGHQDAQRIAAAFKKDKEESTAQDEKDKLLESHSSQPTTTITALTSSSLFSSEQKSAQQNKGVESQKIDNSSILPEPSSGAFI